ncbi:MAG: formate--tetrahydrofolate ligase [Myxococcales bacterium]|nr:formate--tetrahydrofolate ligase [Polyangiaceae bacterium]MDW8250703.1 formate--tetrahydrofolate ligase [Myxococcales bacterium]
MRIALQPQSIEAVAHELGLDPGLVIPWGRQKAKIELRALEGAPAGKGRLILVSAINPTPAGEGKTTTAIGLAMGLRRLGKRTTLCLREPSLGPVFGVKGGGTGGGKASLVPAEDINLHFTGDLHAVTTAHNLLSAMIDNALHFRERVGQTEGIDPRRITWGRALDMNDRSLRGVVVGLGGPNGGVPREDRFDITAASEIMAIAALATDHEDLEQRLARILVAESYDRKPITAGDLGAASAMAAVLRDALLPNLVQTSEGGPALVHLGPFANIAHGCNSVIATRLGLKLGDYTVTEAGFGFDLGGEKFLNIKCRSLGAWPRLVVLVATLRALKMHGGVPVKEASTPNPDALLRGLEHLDHHLATLQSYQLPAVVAINRFPDDQDDELRLVEEATRRRGAVTVRSEGFARGGEGTLELARAVADLADASDEAPPAPCYLYALEDPLEAKIEQIARKAYGAEGVSFSTQARKDIERISKLGYGQVPVCMAKTQLSLSDDGTRPGRPTGFSITIREIRLSAGAGFAVALTGDILTMPGLPRVPAAHRVRLLPDGRIVGLMQND